MKDYANKVVIITGAGSGMGRAMVGEFVSRGARVAAMDINLERAKETVDRLSDPSMAFALHVDVSDQDSAKRGVDAVIARWGRVDLLCNNAGILDGHATAHEVSLAEWNRVLAVNLTGPFLMARAVIPQMLTQGKGAIINTSSTSGFSAAGGGSAYTASKHGVIGLTRQLTFEYGARGIRVNSICPGATATPLALPEHNTASPDMDLAISKVPARRWCQPEEIAKLAAFLGSDDADYVHGSDYVMDGGWLTAARDPF
ncbi:SDR family NAD(P)-dependent oxidoreductase [Rhizobium leguminosarum]|uniref:SDR family NAD(P)-dependent oxidoreductase n=1 Tax=Rhizobium leguminosarum TaxID=384 RepID=UPI00098F06A3|nr:glucose 1-dehydrogenase [Rhizobium leguminosarum]ASS58005.1 3-oxoacyl-ACP reductase [Rhizobium leguminosarum bv. viciae]MBB4333275.1 NAD(P)-dependent dehydrogenase (short-subunit alcohol dehydrogenase family) [Rhizobium leguminosarum]MBB4358955.1 NAD(P)-dependent dehydrogenase (short-subunit alcohol dehydrogenase family) [Rhizobium leguminosarum]MBB4390893.1 NAD(P)-dependent dehydrogenase (short-subunit alcohol dehydrogenase family) [Rhizobium leguminosarum]MBB4553448.1 NAD(P)-dependent deh